MNKTKVQIVDYESFLYKENDKWHWNIKQKEPDKIDDIKPPFPDPVYPDFGLDEDVIVIDDEVVTDDTTTVFAHRGRFNDVKIETKKSFILNLVSVDIAKTTVKNEIDSFNINIDKRNLYVKELESTAPFEVITLKSKEIINLAIE